VAGGTFYTVEQDVSRSSAITLYAFCIWIGYFFRWLVGAVQAIMVASELRIASRVAVATSLLENVDR
jgi:Na+/alanine symporter